MAIFPAVSQNSCSYFSKIIKVVPHRILYKIMIFFLFFMAQMISLQSNVRFSHISVCLLSLHIILIPRIEQLKIAVYNFLKQILTGI